MTRVEVQCVCLNYGDLRALEDLSFTLDGDGIYGLLGRNASGKTSLLSVLAGFRKASAGEVTIDGEPVFENAWAMRRVCLIRERGDTVDNSERVKDALEFASTMRPWWDAAYAERLLDRFGLPSDKKIGQLSRGQRAALACTLGLASRAPVTAFDESHLGLDAPARYMFYDELLNDFMEHPRVIVLSTHHIEEVSSMLGEVVIIDRGRLLMQSDTGLLRSRGATLVGAATAVEQLSEGLEVLSKRRLGPTLSAAVFGDVGEGVREAARGAGVEIGTLPLQDLFVHLTTHPQEDEA